MIVSLDDIKRYLKIDLSDRTYDDFLTNWLNKAQNLVEEYCNQVFELKNFVEIVDGTGSNYLYVKNLPINSVSSIEYTEDGVNWLPWTNRVWHNEYIIFSNAKFPKGIGNMRVTYTAGWVNPPALIYKVITEMVAEIWQEGPGLSRLGLESGGSSIQGSVSRNYRDLLERHEKLLRIFKIDRSI